MKNFGLGELVVTALALAFLAALLAAHAQQAKIARVGYLSPLTPSGDSTRREAFRQGLRELGYVEGRNIAIEYRFAEGRHRPVAGARGRVGPTQGGRHGRRDSAQCAPPRGRGDPMRLIAPVIAPGVLAAPSAADAQQPEKLYRVGILHHRSAPDPHFEAFRKGLQELGYREGENLEISHQKRRRAITW